MRVPDRIGLAAVAGRTGTTDERRAVDGVVVVAFVPSVTVQVAVTVPCSRPFRV
jgi:hypothetical protein